MTEIAKMLVLSTAHLSEDDCNIWLHERSGAYQKGDYGWFVHVPDPQLKGVYEASLYECMRHAWANCCDWIMFDRDGPIIEGLPTYDW